VSVESVVLQAMLAPVGEAAASRLRQMRFALNEIGVASTPAVLSFVTMLYRFAPDQMSHAHRVASLSHAIGRSLGLPAWQLAEIERAALLHDIGKVVLPEPAPEGPGEGVVDRALELRQVTIAADLLRTVAFLRAPAAMIAAMYECADGSGLPFGLAGDAIPIGARVIAVAEALDGMATACRDFGWSPEVAVVELVRAAGARYDADVVAAALRMVEAGGTNTTAWPMTPSRIV
jgi:cyclic di-GMP phosphodiesterase